MERKRGKKLKSPCQGGKRVKPFPGSHSQIPIQPSSVSMHIRPWSPPRKQSLRTVALAHYLWRPVKYFRKGMVKYRLQVMGFCWFFFSCHHLLLLQREKQMVFRGMFPLKNLALGLCFSPQRRQGVRRGRKSVCWDFSHSGSSEVTAPCSSSGAGGNICGCGHITRANVPLCEVGCYVWMLLFPHCHLLKIISLQEKCTISHVFMCNVRDVCYKHHETFPCPYADIGIKVTAFHLSKHCRNV